MGVKGPIVIYCEFPLSSNLFFIVQKHFPGLSGVYIDGYDLDFIRIFFMDPVQLIDLRSAGTAPRSHEVYEKYPLRQVNLAYVLDRRILRSSLKRECQ